MLYFVHSRGGIITWRMAGDEYVPATMAPRDVHRRVVSRGNRVRSTVGFNVGTPGDASGQDLSVIITLDPGAASAAANAPGASLLAVVSGTFGGASSSAALTLAPRDNHRRYAARGMRARGIVAYGVPEAGADAPGASLLSVVTAAFGAATSGAQAGGANLLSVVSASFGESNSGASAAGASLQASAIPDFGDASAGATANGASLLSVVTASFGAASAGLTAPGAALQASVIGIFGGATSAGNAPGASLSVMVSGVFGAADSSIPGAHLVTSVSISTAPATAGATAAGRNLRVRALAEFGQAYTGDVPPSKDSGYYPSRPRKLARKKEEPKKTKVVKPAFAPGASLSAGARLQTGGASAGAMTPVAIMRHAIMRMKTGAVVAHANTVPGATLTAQGVYFAPAGISQAEFYLQLVAEDQAILEMESRDGSTLIEVGRWAREMAS